LGQYEARQPHKVCARVMVQNLGSYTTFMVAISNGSGYGAVENLARFTDPSSFDEIFTFIYII